MKDGSIFVTFTNQIVPGSRGERKKKSKMADLLTCNYLRGG